MCYFLGKLSDDPENIDCIPTIFNHKQARSKSEIIKADQRRKRYKNIYEIRNYIKSISKIISKVYQKFESISKCIKK